MTSSITAKTKFLRISPRKVRLVARQLPGLSVSEALNRLAYLPNRSASPLIKLLKQAAGNANSIRQINNPADLIIDNVIVGAGPTYKRFRPVSRGRAHHIKKRTSHIHLMVKPKTTASPAETSAPEPKNKKSTKPKK